MNTFRCMLCNGEHKMKDAMLLTISSSLEIYTCEKCYEIVCIYMAIKDDENLVDKINKSKTA